MFAMSHLKTIHAFLLSLGLTMSGVSAAESNKHWIQSVSPSLLEGTPWSDAATSHNIDPWLLYAITLEESGEYDAGSGLLRPWPYQLHYQGKTTKYPSKKAAIEQIRKWEKEGVRNYDIGPLQINRRWHGHRVPELADLLTVEQSLDLAAYLIAETIQLSGEDEELGIGRYRSWKENEARAYAQKIHEIRIQLPGR